MKTRPSINSGHRFPSWTLGLLGILLLILVPVLYYLPRAQAAKNPAAHIPTKAVHVDHKDIVQGDFKTGQDVTRACLECHERIPHGAPKEPPACPNPWSLAPLPGVR